MLIRSGLGLANWARLIKLYTYSVSIHYYMAQIRHCPNNCDYLEPGHPKQKSRDAGIFINLQLIRWLQKNR